MRGRAEGGGSRPTTVYGRRSTVGALSVPVCAWALWHQPWTVDRGPLDLPLRNRPEVDLASVDVELFLGFPITHVEGVRHDARARPQLLHELRHQLDVQRGEQVQRDNGRFADVGGEEISVQ